VASVLQHAGVAHETNVTSVQRGADARTHLSSEIDALVVDPSRRQVLVLEAKDLAFPFSARRIRSEIDKYSRQRGHFEKLTSKVENVRSHLEEVLEMLGAAGPGWSVRGIFVTRENSPAGCLEDAPFDFVLLDDLPNLLRQA